MGFAKHIQGSIAPCFDDSVDEKRAEENRDMKREKKGGAWMECACIRRILGLRRTRTSENCKSMFGNRIG